MDKKPTKLAIVSDQAIYLRGLTSLVMSISGLRLVGEARSAAEAVQLCDLTRPEMILLDLNISAGQRVAIIRQLHQKCPLLKVVLMAGAAPDGPAEDKAETKQVYYLARDVSEEEFKSAIEQIQHTSLDKAHSSFGHQAYEDAGGETADGAQTFPEGVPHRNEEILLHELLMAGKIQADILPEEEPSIAGWEIAARLVPARETSGDFYDFISLSDHKLGIVVADVTDKGMGAAIFMALSSTLIRNYASRFPTLPALILSSVSERILSDTRGGMFVTALFGVLEPHTGRFIYANAGHPPAYLISTQRGRESVDALRPTGMVLGVSEQAQWKQKIVKLRPGDLLILYTDGITEAQNPQGAFFGEERLLDVALANIGCSARQLLEAMLAEVHHFVGDAPQDDIALVVIRREE